MDGVFGAVADRLREEVAQLYQQGLMHKNCTHLVSLLRYSNSSVRSCTHVLVYVHACRVQSASHG